MNIWKSLSGMMEVEITSASPEETLDAILDRKIQLDRIKQKTELAYSILIQRSDYDKLTKLLLRHGASLQIVQKKGIYWKIQKILYRPILAVSMILLLLSAIMLPQRILFIQVNGNQTVPDQLILEAAEKSGICFGASRKLIRSEKVKNSLLSSLPQLQWAGVNSYGCTAVISVRERGSTDEPENSATVSNVIAERDGYILYGNTLKGTALFQPGDTVSKGQTLISGYRDNGITIRAGRAEGEVFAGTNHKFRSVLPISALERTEVLDRQYHISLLIGKKRINLWKDSRISDMDCGRMYEEYFVSLPGNFRLPIGLCIDQYIFYDTQTTSINESEAQLQLINFADSYLLNQMVAGQIIEKHQNLVKSDELYILDSSYSCTEMIGREQLEQIGDINE